MKNSLILDKVMQLCRGKELQPFPFLYSPFLHFFICQPSIDSLPSLSLYLLLPAPFVVPYIPVSLSTFPFPTQPSSFPLNLPLSNSTFPFPTKPSPFLLNLPLSNSTFLFPSQPSPFQLYLPLSNSIFPFPTFLVPTFPLSYLSLSLPISFPTSPLFSLPTFPPSLFSAVTLPLFFLLPFFLSFPPPLFPLFLSPFLFPSPSPYLFPSLPLLLGL